MAAFWGFLSALLCVVCLVAGVIAGWYVRESYDKDQKKKEKDKPIANYRANYSVCDPNKANEINEARYYSIICNGHTSIRYATYDRSTNKFTDDCVEHLFDLPRFRREIANDPNASYKRYFHAGDDVAITVQFTRSNEDTEANKTDEVYNVINFGTPKFISRGEFYASAKGKNSSFLRYDPKSEDFIQENGTHMYCQEAIRDELEKRFLADDAVYIHWSGDNTYSRVIMKEDEADEGADNTTSGD